MYTLVVLLSGAVLFHLTRGGRMHPVPILLTGCVLGCGTSWEDVKAVAEETVDARRAELDARLAQLESIAQESADVPWNDVEPVDLADREPLRWSGDGGNVLVTTPAVVALGPFDDPPSLWWGANVLQPARRLQRGAAHTLADRGSIENTRADVTAAIDRVTTPRYLVLVRSREATDAEVVELDAAGFVDPDQPIGTFVSGVFLGDALVYDLSGADGELLGAVPLTARSSGSVRLTAAGDDLQADLASNLKRDLARKLAPHSADEVGF
jgi:hypothetical protein